jgi:hypothetical protein
MVNALKASEVKKISFLANKGIPLPPNIATLFSIPPELNYEM